MTIRRIEPGARLSQAVIHGGTLYLAARATVERKLAGPQYLVEIGGIAALD